MARQQCSSAVAKTASNAAFYCAQYSNMSLATPAKHAVQSHCCTVKEHIFCCGVGVLAGVLAATKDVLLPRPVPRLRLRISAILTQESPGVYLKG